MTTQEKLHKIMALPDCVAEVTRTLDGFYLARDYGDCGFNRFLGSPSPGPVGQEWAWSHFSMYSLAERKHSIRLARAKGINLRQFLVKQYHD